MHLHWEELDGIATIYFTGKAMLQGTPSTQLELSLASSITNTSTDAFAYSIRMWRQPANDSGQYTKEALHSPDWQAVQVTNFIKDYLQTVLLELYLSMTTDDSTNTSDEEVSNVSEGTSKWITASKEEASHRIEHWMQVVHGQVYLQSRDIAQIEKELYHKRLIKHPRGPLLNRRNQLLSLK